MFISDFDNTLSSLKGKGNPNNREIYVIGDFNIDFSRRSKDAGKIRLKDMVVKYNMRQIITNPTRISPDGKSLIDLLFTTLPSEMIMNSGTLTVIISDHLPIFIQKKMKRPHHPKAKIALRKNQKYTCDNFACILGDDDRWR